MEVSQSNQDLSCDELCLLFVKSSYSAEVVEDVTPFDVVQDEVESEFVLENVLHIDNKRVVGLAEDVLFCSGVQDLALFDQDVFVDSLQGVCLVVDGINHQKHLAERPLVDQLLDLEVFQHYYPATCVH